MTAGKASDAELWRRVGEGDSRSFEELFERHARRVYNYCFRCTADWTAAEDLTSSVFLEAWKKRRELRLSTAGESFLPWLLGVATNLIRNRGRRIERFGRAMKELWASETSHEDQSPDLVARAADEERMATLLAAIKRLPRAEQEVLALYAWADLTYGEIAEALEVPIGTVRSRLARARAHLRLDAIAQSEYPAARRSEQNVS
jgi:RNA polymerase sigma-70 factor (ECF subfamily)